MVGLWRRLVISILALGAWTSAAGAEEWVVIGKDTQETRYDLDVSSIVREGDIVQSWVRNIPKRPQRDVQGRQYTETIWARFDDCKSLKFDLGASIYHDRQGRTVATYQDRPARQWQPLPPGSIGSLVLKVACTVANGETVPDVRSGDWRIAAGDINRDGHQLLVLIDEIANIEGDVISVISRNDFRDFQYRDGVPYRYAVTETAFDCARRQGAVIGQSYLITPTRVIMDDAIDASKVKLAPIPPGSPGYKYFEEICSAPRMKVAGDKGGTQGGFSVGTAWASSKGYLITASHVVEGGSKIALYQNAEKVADAIVVAADPANDLAVLKITSPIKDKLIIIPLSDKPGSLGRSVFTLGYPAPDVMGQRIKMSSGEISGTAGMQDDARFLQISIPIQQGNSGGPVLGFDGSALGVVEAKLAKLSAEKDAPRPEMVNYAMKIAYLRPLLDDLPDLKNYEVLKPGATPDDLIEQARKAVYMVVVAP